MEEQNNDFRSLVLQAYARTKLNDAKEQIIGYKTLIKISKERKWIVYITNI